jgi:hypothetical protein
MVRWKRRGALGNVRPLDVYVFQLHVQEDEVQLCFARASQYYYLLLCSDWLEQYINVT